MKFACPDAMRDGRVTGSPRKIIASEFAHQGAGAHDRRVRRDAGDDRLVCGLPH